MTNYGKVRPGNHRGGKKKGAQTRGRGTVAKTTKERAEWVRGDPQRRAR